ncbi:hypothetical protein KY331_03390 [Candidatus Woesearchaeota archaeon]|nr:hypothetical protein [Candidatus Woesearchaeota archaeon]
MSLLAVFDRDFDVNSAEELANKLPDWILENEDSLKRIVEEFYGYDKDYFVVRRSQTGDVLAVVAKKDEIIDDVPTLIYKVSRVQGYSGYDFAKVEFLLGWEDYQDDWVGFFEFFRNSCFKILDFVNRHLGDCVVTDPMTTGIDFRHVRDFNPILPEADYIHMRPDVIQYMKACANNGEMPEAPQFTGLGGRKLKLPDVIREVEQKTELGKDFYLVWESLYEQKIASGRKVPKEF